MKDMAENYQSKYQMIFHENANCVVLNDAQFHQPVTINAGKAKGMPPTAQKVKDALEAIDKEGLLMDDKQWWAIYRVLTMPQYGYPTSKPEFCRAMENLAPQVTHRCVYNNWRNVSVHHLAASPDKWEGIANLSEAERHQQMIAVRLLNLLAL